MIINRENAIEFSKLKCGDVFVTRIGEVYMKTERASVVLVDANYINSVRLEDGFLQGFVNDAIVYKLINYEFNLK